MYIQGINGAGGQINQAKVNTEGGLKIRGSVASESEHSVIEGDGFQAFTGIINMTTDVKQSVFYVQNQDTADIMLTSITVGSNISTGGADNSILLESVGNTAVSDAIVTSGTDVQSFNANGGSARQFTGLIKKGPQTSAVNGVSVNGVLADFTTGKQFNLTLIVPKGGSAAIEVTPPAGNTSMNLTIALAFHIVENI